MIAGMRRPGAPSDLPSDPYGLTTEGMNNRRPRRIFIMPRTARLSTRYVPVKSVSRTAPDFLAHQREPSDP